MSVDVNYYSFSPSRADEKWDNFKDVIVGLRNKYKKWESEGSNNYSILTKDFNNVF